jgi:hypothetical protein
VGSVMLGLVNPPAPQFIGGLAVFLIQQRTLKAASEAYPHRAPAHHKLAPLPARAATLGKRHGRRYLRDGTKTATRATAELP